MGLCNELAQLTYALKQNKHVQCIYFAPFRSCCDPKEGDFVNLTVVLDTYSIVGLGLQYEKRISRNEQLSQFGVEINIREAHQEGYTHLPLNPSERRKGNDIFNSTILFDRTGEYTKIKETTENIGVGEHSNLFYYDNLAEIRTPMGDSLEYAMETQKIMTINKGF